jgi:hypothetical protein
MLHNVTVDLQVYFDQEYDSGLVIFQLVLNKLGLDDFVCATESSIHNASSI